MGSMRAKVLILATAALIFVAAVVMAEATHEWALVGMLAAVLVVLAYDTWAN